MLKMQKHKFTLSKNIIYRHHILEEIFFIFLRMEFESKVLWYSGWT